MRVSSVTRPCSSSGTLKSTRMKTRLFFRSRSRMESFAMFDLETFLAHEIDHVADAARVSPLIVVPGNDFHAITLDDAGHRRVNNRGAWVTAIVHRNQLLGLIAEISLERTRLAGFLQRGIHF